VTTERKPKSELLQRVVVGAILVVVAGVELWLGGIAFWVLVTIAGLLMLSEFAGLLKASDRDRKLALFAFCIPLGLLSPLAAGAGFFAVGALFGMTIAVHIATRDWRLAAGLLYVGIPTFALIWLRGYGSDLEGLLFAFWALSLVWATDIGAYFAGRGIGGPKIAPSISPNKTWAGLGGGMVAAVGLSYGLHYNFGLPLILVVLSPILTVLAQVGDFFESWMKRRAGVKDSGTLLPGHGGVLDRLDGLVTSAPFAALIIAFGVQA
jgi:phosphatidate cytidylyltransferase